MWHIKQAILLKLGHPNFISEEHFENWIKYELDDPVKERRIYTEFKKYGL